MWGTVFQPMAPVTTCNRHRRSHERYQRERDRRFWNQRLGAASFGWSRKRKGGAEWSGCLLYYESSQIRGEI
jgi:hypothetical protein